MHWLQGKKATGRLMVKKLTQGRLYGHGEDCRAGTARCHTVAVATDPAGHVACETGTSEEGGIVSVYYPTVGKTDGDDEKGD